VFLHRRILDSDLWSLSPTQVCVAVVCMLKARWEPGRVQGIEVKRGQWLTHYEDIRHLCPRGTTFNQVRQSIKRLASNEIGFLHTEVVTRFGRHFLLLTVINYDTWQNLANRVPTGHHTDSNSPFTFASHSLHTTITEEVKEVEEKKNTRIPYVAFQEHWNSHPSLPHVRVMTKDRKARLNRRAAYADFRDSWQEAVTALSQSPWHTGQNDRGWRATVDWFLNNDTNWAKALERKDTQEIRTRKSRAEIERIEAARQREAEEKYGEVDPDKLPGFLRDKFNEMTEGVDVSDVKGKIREEDAQ